jgi:ankyrin repeat protein
VARELLNHKADIESRDKDGSTPLLLGKVLKNKLSIELNLLILLFVAVMEENFEVVEFLLNHFANIEVEWTNGITPLILGIFLNIIFLFK